MTRWYQQVHSLVRHPATNRPRTIGPRRLLNAVAAKIAQKMVRPRPLAWPIMAVIEPTNICNLRCPLCPTGERKPGRKKGMMQWELFRKFVDEVGPYLWEVELNNWGESTFHEQLPEMIAYLKRAGIHVALSSNLVLTPRESLDGLIASGLDHLIVSMDGATPATYEQYRRGGDFHQVCSNIQYLSARKKELHAEHPFISCKFLVFKHNQHELPAFRELGRRLAADEVRFAPPYIGPESRTQWLTDLPEFNRYRDSAFGENASLPCHWLWYGVTLNWDGTISPCCLGNSYYPELDFGAISGQAFREVWWNPLYQAARSRFQLRPGRSFDLKVACDDCNYLKAYLHQHHRHPSSSS